MSGEIIVDEAFLVWAHSKLGFRDISDTVYHLNRVGKYNLGELWDMYKGPNPSSNAIPKAISEYCVKVRLNTPKCAICGVTLTMSEMMLRDNLTCDLHKNTPKKCSLPICRMPLGRAELLAGADHCYRHDTSCKKCKAPCHGNLQGLCNRCAEEIVRAASQDNRPVSEYVAPAVKWQTQV
jgi:hypothetical protein